HGEQRRIGGRGGGLGGRSGRLAGSRGNGVFLGHATTLAGAFDAVAVEAGFVGDLARGRRQDLVVGGGRSGGFGGRSGSGRRRRGGGNGARVQGAEHFAGEHGLALALDDLTDHAVGFGQHFHDDLVGLDVDDQLVALDGLARLLVPGGHGAVGNRFREGGGLDFNSHVMNSCLSVTTFEDVGLDVERVVEQFFLLLGVHGRVAASRRSGGLAAGVLQEQALLMRAGNTAHVVLRAVPGTLVHRLFLTPDDLLEVLVG